MCNILFLDGYAVIPQAQWEIALFPLHELFKIMKENSKSMAKLPNTEGGGVSELRKWLPFKKPTQCLKGYYNEMQIKSECLLSPDKAYGCIAWNNCAKLCNFDQNLQLCGGEVDWIFTRGHMPMENAGNSTLLNH